MQLIKTNDPKPIEFLFNLLRQMVTSRVRMPEMDGSEIRFLIDRLFEVREQSTLRRFSEIVVLPDIEPEHQVYINSKLCECTGVVFEMREDMTATERQDVAENWGRLTATGVLEFEPVTKEAARGDVPTPPAADSLKTLAWKTSVALRWQRLHLENYSADTATDVSAGAEAELHSLEVGAPSNGFASLRDSATDFAESMSATVRRIVPDRSKEADSAKTCFKARAMFEENILQRITNAFYYEIAVLEILAREQQKTPSLTASAGKVMSSFWYEDARAEDICHQMLSYARCKTSLWQGLVEAKLGKGDER